MEMRLAAALPVETERLVRRIIGCAMTVHRTLGPGFLEGVYREAMCLEMDASQIAFERERVVPVVYRDLEIATHRLDLVVARLVVVELKAVETLDAVHVAQVISYLRATRLRAGLLFNFNVGLLKDGLRRVVL